MRYPQLANYAVLTVSPNVSLSTIQQVLKEQLTLSSMNQAGQLTYATGLQYAGVLDDLFYYSGRLGVVINHSKTAAGSAPADGGIASLQ